MNGVSVKKSAWMPRWRWVFLIATILALSSTFQAYRMTALGIRPPSVIPIGRLLALNFTLWMVPAAMAPAIFRLVDWLSRHNVSWTRAFMYHAVAAAIFSFVHFLALFMVYAVIWWLDGRLAKIQWLSAAESEYLWNLNFTLVTYGTIAALSYALDFRQRVHERALDVAKLETRLVEARLGSLAGELRPEFLYSSLDTVSKLVHTNPDNADRIISKLADFLRLVLNRSGSIVGPLQDELECVERYIEIEQVRQGSHLSVTLDIDPDTLDAEFPPLTLHSLVEMVLDPSRPPLLNTTLTIQSSHDEASLHVRVKSIFEGSRAAEPPQANQIGPIRDRLRALYGESQEVGVELDDQASAAWITLPFRAAVVAD